MRSPIRPLLLALALALWTGPGCGSGALCGGTETGNCGNAVGSAGDALELVPSMKILSALCSRLQSCDASLSSSDCLAGIMAATNIDTELGVAGGTYASYEELADDEAAGNLASDASALSSCISDIEALGCSDPLVDAGWDPGAPADFSNVAPMIPADPGSCPDVY